MIQSLIRFNIETYKGKEKKKMEIVKGITWLAIIVQIHALYPVSTLNIRFTYILLSEFTIRTGRDERKKRRR